MNVEQLVTVYVKMRDARAVLQRAFDEEDGKIKEQQDAIEKALLELCKEAGVDGLQTAAGSVSRRVKSRYWTTDWGRMKQFIMENDAIDLLEHRVHQTNMKSFLEENPDKLPPGLSIDSRYAITVRRK